MHMNKLFNNRRGGHAPDHVFLWTLGILVVFGILMLSSASSDLGKIKFDDTFFYLKHQIYYGLLPGIAGFLFASFLYYKRWQTMALYLLLVSVGMLLLVFTPLGMHSGGATRWINIGPVSLQPAELLKLTFIIYMAAWLSGKRTKRQTSFTEGYLPFLSISGFIALLIVLQPATTTVAVIMMASLIVYFMSGAKFKYIAMTVVLGFVALAMLVAITPYRMERVKNYFRQDKVDVLGKGYHLEQAKIAIGSGGAMGVGFGQSTTKYKFLPEPIGDSIFAVVAEELGFAGSILLISLYILLFTRGLLIASRCKDKFGQLAVIGIISVVAIQTFINIGAISGILPLTGVPLPFISYGGTALAIFLTMMGVVVNISKHA
ncbi:MAG: Stage V sporulation protein E [Candidatus Wolfebacteria bacterium GW2011_GWE1_48_7]|uniref:Probable peptidoglycan glycosyltransferase FtsW n=2 Tax=Candidatus Wolfeibacteriota TaxID=1752735 RepID=A0A0G4AS66_9BACT|nr:MAG: stage V sporulation protein E, cell division protein FtsW [Candidatus Wolfebacteria bacterium GW2011_GWB1_47_1]KKU42407.1 MAG: Stage V sporulation protein E [Candidatus Wolfebacteria bacterium GW2011_GWB2_46_69]KKU66204.1 MAG: Stage V sporulation protein E [Candidatus Wolfebacteria bacterium GW2011_GWD2_47_17]KKU97449.1 MAG: Stage V sporulation protein E [Candidatus Wolfebacteria bacterium GW2011_GWE1_48_7]HAL24764.1 stage V sporulation protein E [Candidatus Wolfebacteria bacterium]